LTGGKGTSAADSVGLPDHARQVALAIEAFHKASLVHDDIEDDDAFRYGKETLHRRFGVGTAINAGDYLIGLGYRLVSRERKTLGAECAADILDKFADAHLKLSEGQGAELLWRDADDKSITPLDALKIYALKTAPAFEAALYAGLRLAGPTAAYDKLVVEFSRHLGIAFQILNDFKDWEGDEDNKMMAGQDVLSARPTLLLALALDGLSASRKAELVSMLGRQPSKRTFGLGDVRNLFAEADVFTKADKLIEKYRARAEALADEVEPPALRELLYYLVDSVLDRQVSPAVEPVQQLVQLTA
jgi:geranylgeranyl diphosphate synthase, type II